MTETNDDPHCPNCGGAIGQTATYCMHCSADLTDELEDADSDDDGRWGGSDVGAETDESAFGSPSAVEPASVGESGATGDGGLLDSIGIAGFGSSDGSSPTDSRASGTAAGTGDAEQVLDPDGLVDNTLTVVVGLVAGVVVGVVGMAVFGAMTGSAWGVAFGVVVWVASTAHLVRRRTVQGAVSRGAYAVAIVFLSIPLITLSPVVSVDGGVTERIGGSIVLLFVVGIPAGVVAAVGYAASRFVPDGAGSEG